MPKLRGKKVKRNQIFKNYKLGTEILRKMYLILNGYPLGYLGDGIIEHKIKTL